MLLDSLLCSLRVSALPLQFGAIKNFMKMTFDPTSMVSDPAHTHHSFFFHVGTSCRDFTFHVGISCRDFTFHVEISCRVGISLLFHFSCRDFTFHVGILCRDFTFCVGISFFVSGFHSSCRDFTLRVGISLFVSGFHTSCRDSEHQYLPFSASIDSRLATSFAVCCQPSD